MVRHKEQRVGIFIDVQNMYYSAKQLYNSKVNFTQILKEGVAGRRLVRAIAYAIRADIKEESHFYDALTNIGFEVKLKELQIFLGGAKKGDWDVGLAMDIIRMVNKLDVVVLVSGDGDFKELVEYVQANGCRAEVMAFAKTTSAKLKDEADMFIDMGQNLNRFLIGKIADTHHRQNKGTQQKKAEAAKKAEAVKEDASKKEVSSPVPTAKPPEITKEKQQVKPAKKAVREETKKSENTKPAKEKKPALLSRIVKGTKKK